MAALLACGPQHALGCRHSSFSGRQLSARPLPRIAVTYSTVTRAAKIGPLKDWEHYELTKGGKPVRLPMPMRTGDTVKVISGHDKGKVGKVTKVVTKMGQIIVEGVNIKTKHNKPVREGEPGNISERESPIHHSNAMLYSTKEKVASRISFKVGDDGTKVRVLKKTGEVLPNRPDKSDKSDK